MTRTLWATSQGAMEIVIIVIYWGIHLVNKPYKKSGDNDLQNWMYLAELLIIIGLMCFFPEEGSDLSDAHAGTITLFVIYFLAIAFILYRILRVGLEGDTDDSGDGKNGGFIQLAFEKTFDV